MTRKSLASAMVLLALGAAPLAMAQTASPGATPAPSATTPSSTPQSPSAPSNSTRSPPTTTPSTTLPNATTNPNSATMSGGAVNSTANMTSAQRQIYSSCMAKAQNNGSTSAQNQQTCMSQMPQSAAPNH